MSALRGFSAAVQHWESAVACCTAGVTDNTSSRMMLGRWEARSEAGVSRLPGLNVPNVSEPPGRELSGAESAAGPGALWPAGATAFHGLGSRNEGFFRMPLAYSSSAVAAVLVVLSVGGGGSTAVGDRGPSVVRARRMGCGECHDVCTVVYVRLLDYSE